MKTFILFFMGLVCLGTSISFGQSTISAQLIDNQSGKPVENALITTADNTYQTTSDSTGHFTIKAALPVKIHVQHVSFITTSFLLTKASGIIIDLQPSITTLQEILIEDYTSNNLIQTTSKSEFKEQLPINVGDLFNDINGFHVVKRGNFAMEPVLRGFKYEQLNTMYDGGLFISAACPNRMDPVTTHISPDEVKKIEVIKGPYNVRYGNSLGGIVNVVTESPGYLGSHSIGGYVNTGYVSNSSGYYGGAGIDMAKNQTFLQVRGSYQNFDDYESGNGSRIASSFSSANYAIKAGWLPDPFKKLQLTFRQSFAWDVKHAGLPMDTKDDKATMAIVDYESNFGKNNAQFWRTKLYFAYVDHVMDNRDRPNFMMVEATSPVQSYTYGGRVELEFHPGQEITLFTGTDFQRIDKDGSRERLIKRNMMTGEVLDMPMSMTDKIWQDSYHATHGIFAELHLNTYKVQYALGLRGNYTYYDALDPESDFTEEYGTDLSGHMLTYNAHVNALYTFNQHHQLKAEVGYGAKPPTLTELYINHFSVGKDAYEYVGNPTLDAETNLQFDLSYHFQSPLVDGYINGFYSILDNYIMAKVDTTLTKKYMPSEPPTSVKRFINVPDAYQTGFEWALNWHILRALTLETGQYYTYAQNETWDEALPEIPPLTTKWALHYHKKAWTAEIGSRLSARQSRISDSFDESETPSYITYHAAVTYAPNRHWLVSINADNLTDELYYDHLSRPYKNMTESSMFYEPGRQIQVNLKYSF